MFGIEGVGFKPLLFRLAKMNVRYGYAASFHFSFGCIQQGRAYAFMLFRGFNEESVKKGLCRILCFGISDTSDNSVIFVYGDPERVSALKIA